MAHLTRRLAEERGQALVETALVLPLLILLLVGLAEFARAWSAYHVLANAAREAARAAAVADPAITRDSVAATIRHALARGALDPRAVRVTLAGVNDLSGTPVRVELHYPFRFFLSDLLGKTVPSSVPLHAAVAMRNE